MLSKKKTVNIWQMLVASVLLIVSLIIYGYDFSQISYLELCWFVIADVLLCACLFISTKSARINNACFLFWIITTLFSFGQNIAFLFIHKDFSHYNVLYLKSFSLETMIEGTVFTMLAYNFLSLGLAVCFVRKDGNSEEDVKLNIEKYNVPMLWVARGLFAVSVIPQMIYMYAEITLFMSKGYGYTATGSLPSLVLILHYWFMPSIILFYISKSNMKKKPVFETCVFIAVALMFMLTGDRGSALSMLLVLIFLRSIFKQGTMKTIYIWCVVLILLIPFVKFFRIAFSGGTLDALGAAWNEMVVVNPLIDMLLELGGTQRIIIWTMKRVVEDGFAYGTAYLDFFIKMLPSSLGVSMFYPTLAQWVMGTSGYQTKGFSIWGEAYLNFGDGGILFMYVIGKVFGWLLNARDNDSSLKIALSAITLYFFADISRRSVSEFGFVFLYNILFTVFAVFVVADIRFSITRMKKRDY